MFLEHQISTCAEMEFFFFFFDLLFKKTHKSNIYLDNKYLKWGKYHYEINVFFSNTHWPQLTAPVYSIFFKPPFASLTALHFLSPDKRSETIPSSRITPDPLDSQLHVGASSLQLTSLIFYMVQVRGLEWP